MGHTDTITPNTVTVSTAETALPALAGDEVILQASVENAQGSVIRIGTAGMANTAGGTGICFELGPGDSISLTLRTTTPLVARGSASGLFLYASVLD